MVEILRLPLNFDPASLLRDLSRIADDCWIPHFNRGDYVGAWHGVALRGAADANHPILELVANPGVTDWSDTDVMQRCPYFKEVVSRLACPLKGVRLLRLAPGSMIKEHVDPYLGPEHGEARLHVPVQTHPDVQFRLDGELVVLRPGETWFLDVSHPHSVVNNSPESRVHMVIDCIVNDWLHDVFRTAIAAQPFDPRSGNSRPTGPTP